MTNANKEAIEDAEILKETITTSLDFDEPIERIAQQHRYLTHANNKIIKLALDTLDNHLAYELKRCIETQNIDVVSRYWLKLDFVKAIAEEHNEWGFKE